MAFRSAPLVTVAILMAVSARADRPGMGTFATEEVLRVSGCGKQTGVTPLDLAVEQSGLASLSLGMGDFSMRGRSTASGHLTFDSAQLENMRQVLEFKADNLCDGPITIAAPLVLKKAHVAVNKRGKRARVLLKVESRHSSEADGANGSYRVRGRGQWHDLPTD